MKNEDKIVELLTDMLFEFKDMKEEFKDMKEEQKETNKRLQALEDDMHITHSLLKHHEDWLRQITKLLEDDVPRYDKVLKIETLSDGRSILHKS